MYASLNKLNDKPVICIMLCSNLFDASNHEIRVSLLLFFVVSLRSVDHVTSCLDNKDSWVCINELTCMRTSNIFIVLVIV